MKRLVLLLAVLAAACNIHGTPAQPVQYRAFAVDVFPVSPVAIVSVDGWFTDAPDQADGSSSQKHFATFTQMQNIGGQYMHLDLPAFRSDIESANLHIRAVGFKDYDCVMNVPRNVNATVMVGNGPIVGNRYSVGGNCLPVMVPEHPTRQGLTRGSGKEVFDDTGSYHPLGLTFFWAMQGWHGDRGRLQQHIDFLSKYLYDYVRILAQVDWAGWDINPDWPDYEQTLAEVIDAFYAAGIRVEITMLGSPYADPSGLAHRVARVVAARPNKVVAIEVWNEWDQNGGSIQTLKDAARILLAESGVPLVGLSSNGGDSEIAQATRDAGATLSTVHTDRGQGDDGWRMVRQCFDFKDIPGVVDSNEPPGPNSSVNTMSSPIQLAMMRACGVQSGGAMFVLHVGDMVTGQEVPERNRHANLWQTGCGLDDPRTPDNPCPYIDHTLKVVRSIDAYLPLGVENWQKTPGNPVFTPQALKPDTAGWDTTPTVNRFYAGLHGLQFSQMLMGLRGTQVPFTLTMPGAASCHIKALNPETGEQFEFDLNQGDRWMAPGRDDGMAGLILNGDCK